MNMVQRLSVRLAAAAFGVLCVSCRSTLAYMDHPPADAAVSPDAAVSGYFVSKDTLHENDIVVSGTITQDAWSSFVPFPGLHYTWKGELSLAGREQPLSITTWFTSASQDRDREITMGAVSIKGLPASFACKMFPVYSSRPSFTPVEKYNTITEFMLNGEKFFVGFPRKWIFLLDNHILALLDKKQIVQITGGGGRSYADFDTNSYRIYECPSGVPIEQFQMIVAAFSVVQHICQRLAK